MTKKYKYLFIFIFFFIIICLGLVLLDAFTYTSSESLQGTIPELDPNHPNHTVFIKKVREVARLCVEPGGESQPCLEARAAIEEFVENIKKS